MKGHLKVAHLKVALLAAFGALMMVGAIYGAFE
jgi:hypothetical protein